MLKRHDVIHGTSSLTDLYPEGQKASSTLVKTNSSFSRPRLDATNLVLGSNHTFSLSTSNPISNIHLCGSITITDAEGLLNPQWGHLALQSLDHNISGSRSTPSTLQGISMFQLGLLTAPNAKIRDLFVNECCDSGSGVGTYNFCIPLNFSLQNLSGLNSMFTIPMGVDGFQNLQINIRSQPATFFIDQKSNVALSALPTAFTSLYLRYDEHYINEDTINWQAISPNAQIQQGRPFIWNKFFLQDITEPIPSYNGLTNVPITVSGLPPGELYFMLLSLRKNTEIYGNVTKRIASCMMDYIRLDQSGKTMYEVSNNREIRCGNMARFSGDDLSYRVRYNQGWLATGVAGNQSDPTSTVANNVRVEESILYVIPFTLHPDIVARDNHQPHVENYQNNSFQLTLRGAYQKDGVSSLARFSYYGKVDLGSLSSNAQTFVPYIEAFGTNDSSLVITFVSSSQFVADKSGLTSTYY